jgi:hypothetical protein
LVKCDVDPEKMKDGPRAYMEDRATLGHFAKKTVEKGHMELYQQSTNVRSLDGCGGLRAARRGKGEWIVLQDILIWLRRVSKQWEAMMLGFLVALESHNPTARTASSKQYKDFDMTLVVFVNPGFEHGIDYPGRLGSRG